MNLRERNLCCRYADQLYRRENTDPDVVLFANFQERIPGSKTPLAQSAATQAKYLARAKHGLIKAGLIAA